MPGKRKDITYEMLCAEYEAVYRYLLALCRNREDAEDIVQETFVKALKAKEEFDGDSSLYTWLCAIGKNLWLNRCRKAGREIPWETEVLLNTAAEGAFEEEIAEKDTAMAVHRVLHGLPEPYKEVFSLRVFGQLSYREIAELFGKTESWARVTYHRGKKMILDEMRNGGLL